VVHRLSLLLGRVEEKFGGPTAARLIDNKKGVTAVEYGLIAALIAVAAVVIMGTTGTNLSSVFNTVANNL
jgi:pilus assembly protein Flp/PilA